MAPIRWPEQSLHAEAGRKNKRGPSYLGKGSGARVWLGLGRPPSAVAMLRRTGVGGFGSKWPGALRLIRRGGGKSPRDGPFVRTPPADIDTRFAARCHRQCQYESFSWSGGKFTCGKFEGPVLRVDSRGVRDKMCRSSREPPDCQIRQRRNSNGEMGI